MQKLNEHELWLSIANNDLQAAKVLMQSKLYSTGIYHCQQAADFIEIEKSELQQAIEQAEQIFLFIKSKIGN